MTAFFKGLINMSLLLSESGSEPLTTSDVKAWAKVENSDEDSLISSLITSCRREVESFTKNVLRAQIWQTTHTATEGKYVFYSPRITASSVTITIDDEAYTDYTLTNGRLRLGSQYYGGEEIVINWSIVTSLESLAPLKQALLDLITYRFYNRGAYDMPQNIKTVFEQYRVFNV